MGGRGKLPFSYCSSSCTSSSPEYKTQLPPLGNSQSVSEANSARVDSDSTLELRSGAGDNIEKEHMFEKVVTPSDDRNGKPWRFRYSYWSSSQSYVMTKGWSRFVKDKKLDAGDIVSFQRGVGELGKGRLFIDWRRRPDASEIQVSFHPHHQQQYFPLHRSIPWSPLLMRPPPTGRDNLHLSQINPLSRNSYYGGYPSGSNVVNQGGAMGSVVYLRSAVVSEAPQMGMGMMEWQQKGGVLEPVAFDSVPVVQGKAAAKRLRLFGVNMDYSIPESDEYNVISTTTMASQPLQRSSSSQHPLQLRLKNGTPLIPTDFLNPNKGKASMSLDLDI
ncbi:Detected protein of unknown function [Hibiscus syriacus]|uniref:TF-B3 domain-containing protein n=1 Tax=Hibiscus syriacus TaxID=106335 RepID=A0A6A3AV71_HIBSY|nr:Detected protein of unknown function [Hibiscus syriacus]